MLLNGMKRISRIFMMMAGRRSSKTLSTDNFNFRFSENFSMNKALKNLGVRYSILLLVLYVYIFKNYNKNHLQQIAANKMLLVI